MDRARSSNTSLRRAAGPIAFALVLASGCASYSPPVRTVHFGTPGRVGGGDLAVGGGAAGSGGLAPIFGEAQVAYGFNDEVAIEGGSTFTDGWALGYLGSRLTSKSLFGPGSRVVGDLEFGLGLGVGGNANDPTTEYIEDGRSWHERLAGGGYVGGGVGVNIDWFSLFGRMRLQFSDAYNASATLWWSGLGGMQFRIRDVVDLYAGVGAYGLANEWTNNYGFLYDLGLVVHFDVRGDKRRRAARKTRRAR